MHTVTLISYTPGADSGLLTAQLVECYRDVFADGPWHEWLRCPQCDSYWGKKDGALLVSWQFKHCGVPLVDYWPRERVLDDICREITRDARCTLAVSSDQVVGFCWGYPIRIPDLEAKVGIGVAKEIEESFGTQAHVGYQDEVGVLSQYRGAKIAHTMNKRRIQAFVAQGLQVIVSRARRTPSPSVTFKWYTEKLGYDVLVEYPPEDGRVILGRPLAGLLERY